MKFRGDDDNNLSRKYALPGFLHYHAVCGHGVYRLPASYHSRHHEKKPLLASDNHADRFAMDTYYIPTRSPK